MERTSHFLYTHAHNTPMGLTEDSIDLPPKRLKLSNSRKRKFRESRAQVEISKELKSRLNSLKLSKEDWNGLLGRLVDKAEAETEKSDEEGVSMEEGEEDLDEEDDGILLVWPKLCVSELWVAF